MTADHLYFAWAIDPDGHPWAIHQCEDGEDVWRLPPPWRIVSSPSGDGQMIEPSFDCRRCRRHTFLLPSDRIDWTEVERALAHRFAAGIDTAGEVLP